MSTPIPPSTLDINSMLGKFRLLELLGEGGMGMVWCQVTPVDPRSRISSK